MRWRGEERERVSQRLGEHIGMEFLFWGRGGGGGAVERMGVMEGWFLIRNGNEVRGKDEMGRVDRMG